MKAKFPEGTTGASVGGRDIEIDEDGLAEVTETEFPHLVAHGATVAVEEAPADDDSALDSDALKLAIAGVEKQLAGQKLSKAKRAAGEERLAKLKAKLPPV